MRKAIVSACLIAVIIGSAVGVWFLMKITSEPSPEPGVRPMLVRTHPLQETTYRRTLTAFGTVRAVRTVVVSSEVGGKVRFVSDNLRPGARVQAPPPRSNDPDRKRPPRAFLLVRIDTQDLEDRAKAARLRVEQALAERNALEREAASVDELLALAGNDVKIASDDVAKITKLVDPQGGGALPKSALDQAKLQWQRFQSVEESLRSRQSTMVPRRKALNAAIELARTERSVAERAIEKAYIYAPFSGVVVDRHVEEGQMVGAMVNVPLFTIMEDGEVEAPLHLAASALKNLRVGAKATLTTESHPNHVWTGRVERIGARIDPINRTVPAYVRAEAEQNGARLRPGLFVKGTLHVDDAPRTAVTIPRRFVQDGRVFIAVYNGKAANPEPVDSRGGGEEQDAPALVARRRVLHVIETLPEHLVLAPPDPSDTTAVRAGDLLITSNLELLHDGAPLRTYRLAFQVQPADTRAGEAFAEAPTVAVLDETGRVVRDAAESVQILIRDADGRFAPGALGGSREVSLRRGLAAFANLRVIRPGEGYRLVAESPSIGAVVSRPFAARPAAARAESGDDGPAPP